MPTLIPSSEDVRVYEIAVMYQPDLQQKEESTLLSEINGLLAEAKATVVFKDPWTKRGLAYPINGFGEAKFVIFYCEMEPAKIRELDNALRLQKGVLRHLVLIPPKGYEAVNYEDRYQQWLKTRETMQDKRTREKEEKLKQNVIAQAKRETKRLAQAKPKKEKAPIEMKDLEQQLDKLISDADIDL